MLILEDDAVCVEGFREKAEMFWSYLPSDWAMVYLGGQHIQENLGLPHKINDWVYKPYNINRCHCYGFRGRPVMERAYQHLHNFASWNVDHHIDHYLGELHKKTEKGLYVPREWLVAQSEGQSDICGKDLELRLFPGAEETIYPVVDLPCVAVTGTYFSGINTIAGVLQYLGVCLGIELGTPEPGVPHFFEETYLGEICRNCFTEPWLTEKLPKSIRADHLRRWAGLQCKQKPESPDYLCGKHPILSLMGEEMMEAWNNPKFICVERPDQDCYESMSRMSWKWHPVPAKYSFGLLRKERNAFFEKHQPELLRLDYSKISENPAETVVSLCEFLKLPVSKNRKKHATAFIKQCQGDFCFEKTKENESKSSGQT